MKTGKIKGTRASYTYDVVYRQAPCKQSLHSYLVSIHKIFVKEVRGRNDT